MRTEAHFLAKKLDAHWYPSALNKKHADTVLLPETEALLQALIARGIKTMPKNLMVPHRDSDFEPVTRLPEVSGQGCYRGKRRFR